MASVAVTAGAHAVPLAVLDPPGRAEVGRLGDVEPVVEPGVVGVGEDNNTKETSWPGPRTHTGHKHRAVTK